MNSWRVPEASGTTLVQMQAMPSQRRLSVRNINVALRRPRLALLSYEGAGSTRHETYWQEVLSALF